MPVSGGTPPTALKTSLAEQQRFYDRTLRELLLEGQT